MVAWLADVEQSANRFYWDCSVYFKDPNLALFLEKLSVDEAFHLQVIRTVETILEDQGAVSPFSVALPDELKFGVMELFQTNQAKIGENTLTLDSLYDCLLRTEFSEWNDFFVYVVESVLKNRSRSASDLVQDTEAFDKPGAFFWQRPGTAKVLRWNCEVTENLEL